MKLSPLTIVIIGLSVLVMALGIGLSQFVPNMEEAKMQREYAEKLLAEANKQKQANDRVKKAIAKVNEIAADWQQVVAVKTPPQDVNQGGINLAVNRLQLTVDSVKFRNNVQRALNAQLRKGGVTVVTGPRIPDPPTSPLEIVEAYYNYPAIRFPVVVFDLGQVTVQGTFDQILEHVRSWSQMPNYLAVTDGLALTGTAPLLTGTYNLSIVGYVRGDKIGPVTQEAGGTGAAPAGGPPGGGPPGGGAPLTGEAAARAAGGQN